MQEGIEFRAVDKVVDAELGYPVEVVERLDRTTCNRLVEKIDAVAHFANCAEHFSDWPGKLYDENVEMCRNLFGAASESGVRMIVYSSSIQVFNGIHSVPDREKQDIVFPYLPIDSDMPTYPRNSYAFSKETGENMLKSLTKGGTVSAIAIRFPWLLSDELVETAHVQGGIERGKCFDGYTYLPMRSAAEATVEALKSNIKGYSQYFVASRDNLEQRSTREVVNEQLAHISWRRPLEQWDSLVDCSRAEDELGWRQPKTLAEAFERQKGILNSK